MSRSRGKIVALMVLAAGLVILYPPSAWAQCSMCRTSLVGAENWHFIQRFNIAVLVLLVPPVTMFCSIFLCLRRSTTSQDRGEKDHQ